MSTRRQAREAALQMLYQIEMSGSGLPEITEEFWSGQKIDDAKSRAFVEQLVKGVLKEKEAIDECIAKHATHWKLGRMPVVDKNVLRLAVFELKESSEIPLKVILNEAIEVAKKFGAEESSTFINGVLDKVAKELRKEEA